jgi:hypothetical protein
MKYLNILLTAIALLLALLVVKVYTFSDSDFVHVRSFTEPKEKEGDELFLNRKTGRIYTYSPKYMQYPISIEEVDLKTGKRKVSIPKN